MKCGRCKAVLHSNDEGRICLSCKLYVYLWRLVNPGQKKKDDKKRWAKHKDRLLMEKIAWQKTEHGKRVRAALGRKYNNQLRAEMITAYGGCCTCCGESQPEFLALDHVHGGGREERRARGGTLGILRRLKREGWPTDAYTVLCHNCNMAKQFYGICPHRRKAEVAA